MTDNPMSGAGLTTTERDMLRYALDLAQEQMYSRGDEFTDEDQAAVDKLRRMVWETPIVRTPCSEPNPCEDGELCGVHEVEQAHADGEHEYCGVTCEVQYPTDHLRNTVLYRAIPGAGGMLNELLRRAAEGPTIPAEACPLHSPTGDPCDCGHDTKADCHPNPRRNP